MVVSKAGKKTHGVGRFYSSLAQRVIPSVSFVALSLIDVEDRHSYPLHIQQLLPSPKSNGNPPAMPKRGRGRPKGSKNHVKPEPVLSTILVLLQGMLETVLAQYQGLTSQACCVRWKVW